MNEAQFWTARLRPQIKNQCIQQGLAHHLERVENNAAEGTPDVDYCIAGVCGKIELKFAPAHPARSTSIVLGKGHGLRRSQIVYAARRIRAGGLIWCAIGTPVMTWFIDLRPMTPEGMDGLQSASVADLSALCCWGSSLPALLMDRK